MRKCHDIPRSKRIAEAKDDEAGRGGGDAGPLRTWLGNEAHRGGVRVQPRPAPSTAIRRRLFRGIRLSSPATRDHSRSPATPDPSFSTVRVLTPLACSLLATTLKRSPIRYSLSSIVSVQRSP